MYDGTLTSCLRTLVIEMSWHEFNEFKKLLFYHIPQVNPILCIIDSVTQPGDKIKNNNHCRGKSQN